MGKAFLNTKYTKVTKEENFSFACTCAGTSVPLAGLRREGFFLVAKKLK
jgi:hypothetical protein